MSTHNIPEDLKDLDSQLKDAGPVALQDATFKFSEDETAAFLFRMRGLENETMDASPGNTRKWTSQIISFSVGALAACMAIGAFLQLQPNSPEERYRGGSEPSLNHEQIPHLIEGAFIALPPETFQEVASALRLYQANSPENPVATQQHQRLLDALNDYLSQYAASQTGEPAWGAAEALVEIQRATDALQEAIHSNH